MRLAARDKTYEMDKISVRQQMNIESNMRGYIDGKKDEIKKAEEEVLDKELEQLEQKHKKLTQSKTNIQRAAEYMSQEQKDDLYKKVKKESIFDESDIVDSIPKKAPGTQESSGNRFRPIESDEEDNEPKVYEKYTKYYS